MEIFLNNATNYALNDAKAWKGILDGALTNNAPGDWTMTSTPLPVLPLIVTIVVGYSLSPRLAEIRDQIYRNPHQNLTVFFHVAVLIINVFLFFNSLVFSLHSVVFHLNNILTFQLVLNSKGFAIKAISKVPLAEQSLTNLTWIFSLFKCLQFLQKGLQMAFNPDDEIYGVLQHEIRPIIAWFGHKFYSNNSMATLVVLSTLTEGLLAMRAGIRTHAPDWQDAASFMALVMETLQFSTVAAHALVLYSIGNYSLVFIGWLLFYSLSSTCILAWKSDSNFKVVIGSFACLTPLITKLITRQLLSK